MPPAELEMKRGHWCSGRRPARRRSAASPYIIGPMPKAGLIAAGPSPVAVSIDPMCGVSEMRALSSAARDHAQMTPRLLVRIADFQAPDDT